MDTVIDKSKIMEDDNIGRLIWKFAIPGIIASLISAIYNIVDTAFIGMLNDTLAMAAVSVIFPLFILINAVGQLIGVGASSYIARLLGAKNKDGADDVASTAIISSVIVGIIFTILILIFLEPILRLLGATDSVMPYAMDYAKPIAIGASLPIMMPTLANIIRSEGNTKLSAVAVALGAIINIVLDPILMFTFNMGVVGASLATVIGQLASVVLLLSYYITNKSYLKLSIKNFKFSKSIYGEIISVGTATFLIQALISISMGLLNIASKPYGNELIASFGIALKLSSLVMFVVIGYNQGFQPIASYNYGAGNYEKLRKAINISIKRTTIFSTLATIVLMIFAPTAINLFSNDPAVIEVGAKTLRYTLLLYPLLGFTQLYAVLYQSLGMPKEALIVGTARQGIFFLPAIIILPKLIGVDGVLLTQAVADLFTVILTAFYAHKTNKDLKNMVAGKTSENTCLSN
ncbi:MATE family efflux transporter [Paraclostridium bifermentans]|uniref:Multidrug export protein MepA n=1 Tax=Paraclostridium bifermentans TaxID=1490 RepID=A0AA44DKQ1_PARBF|nr:MATE family efflux transporter [Paraclostridium bifermentans]MBN8046397.1 MATE family efflux transporter [Paraclostridium bifermentans]NME09557.1 MATE family efflux transporter [Paraclostridium bifermentans]